MLVKNATTALDHPECLEQRRKGKSKLHVACAVDGGRLSRKAFDTALHFCHPGDQMSVVHVADSDLSVIKPVHDDVEALGTSAVKAYYEHECSKAEMTMPGLDAQLQVVPKTNSIRETLLKHTDELLCDILVMGSIELSDPSKDIYLGSVSASIAKKSEAHTVIVKNFVSSGVCGFQEVQAAK